MFIWTGCTWANAFIVQQGSDAFSQSGLYSNHQDIAPRYSVSSSLLNLHWWWKYGLHERSSTIYAEYTIILHIDCCHCSYFVSFFLWNLFGCLMKYLYLLVSANLFPLLFLKNLTGSTTGFIQYCWSAGWCVWNRSYWLHLAAWYFSSSFTF